MKTLFTIICLISTLALTAQDFSSFSIPNNNNWHITGNNGINPAKNFLGTTDSVRLSIRTNNRERFAITANGLTGFGIANPKARLHLTDGVTGTMNFPYESASFEKGGDNKLGIYSTTTVSSVVTGGAAALTLGYSNLKNSNNFYPGYEMQFGGLSSSQYFLRFNALERNQAGLVIQSKSSVLVLDNTGNVGINLNNGGLPVLPTANFHVIGTVRFENLPDGEGSTVVIDNDGYIKRSNANTTKESSAKIEKLETQVKNLTSIVTQLLANPSAVATTKTFLISPNPAFKEINILPVGKDVKPGNYYAELRDIDYNVIVSKTLFSNKLNLYLSNIINGSYLVILYNDKKLIQTEKLLILGDK